MKTTFLWRIVIGCLCLNGIALAEKSVFNMSLEELMAQEVFTSRRGDEQFVTPAAVYSITQEDIRRSGMTSIPELLRMVPGMHVGQLNGNMYGINCRGVNRRYSREMLVMIDGRTVYNQLNNAVYWDRVDTLLSEIDRIEVIRGPGSSLWGANAAQGIVNIITRDPAESEGIYLEGLGGVGGHYENGLAGRIGFSGENYSGRIYWKDKRLMAGENVPYSEQSYPGKFEPGSTAYDGHDHRQGGFRFSWDLGNDRINLQGDFFESEKEMSRIIPMGPMVLVKEDIETGQGGNVLLRHEHTFSDDSSTSLQIYYDHTYLGYTGFEDRRDTYDVDFQHTLGLNWGSQQLIWGLGYRHLNDSSASSGMAVFALNPTDRRDNTYSAFVQDEVPLLDSLKLTFGTKYEHNNYTGSEWQPSAQLLYQPQENQVFWASASRAVIVPSRGQYDGYLMGLPSVVINEPGAKANLIYSYEAGHRFMFSKNVSLDHTLFWNKHKNRNDDSQKLDYVYGYESILRYYYNRGRTELNVTWHQAKSDGFYSDGVHLVPACSVGFRNLYNLRHNLDLDISFFYVDSIPGYESDYGFTIPSRGSLARFDIRMAYYPSESIELSASVSNLFESKHTETPVDPTKGNTEVERQVIFKVAYNY